MSDRVLIVAEPTVSGMHDMERAAALIDHFKVPGMLCINKFDINPEQGKRTEEAARNKGIDLLGRIPFNAVFLESMVQGQAITEYANGSAISQVVKGIWAKILKQLNGQ